MTVGDERQKIEAAELAIGLLDVDEYRRAARRTVIDPDFAEDVSLWEIRLAQRATRIPPLDVPPDLFSKIEARLDADARRMAPVCKVTRHGSGTWAEWALGARIKVLPRGCRLQTWVRQLQRRMPLSDRDGHATRASAAP